MRETGDESGFSRVRTITAQSYRILVLTIHNTHTYGRHHHQRHHHHHHTTTATATTLPPASEADVKLLHFMHTMILYKYIYMKSGIWLPYFIQIILYNHPQPPCHHHHTTTTTDSHHHHNHQTSPSGYHSQVIRKNVLSAVRNDLIMGRFCLRRHYYLIALISLSVCLSGQKLATCRGLYQYTTDLSHKKSLVARCDKWPC